MEIRAPAEDEFAAASALCRRSKAHWGYTPAFLDACAAELAVGPDDCARDALVVAVDGERLVGVAQLSSDGTDCALEKLFVDPGRMGEGIGRRLFRWAAETAVRLGARALVVDSDPGAVPFYRRMGCIEAGTVPSGSIPGRRLPRLMLPLA